MIRGGKEMVYDILRSYSVNEEWTNLEDNGLKRGENDEYHKFKTETNLAPKMGR